MKTIASRETWHPGMAIEVNRRYLGESSGAGSGGSPNRHYGLGMKKTAEYVRQQNRQSGSDR
jgi:hypothetical protein